jgi:hypothetical protein
VLALGFYSSSVVICKLILNEIADINEFLDEIIILFSFIQNP